MHRDYVPVAGHGAWLAVLLPHIAKLVTFDIKLFYLFFSKMKLFMFNFLRTFIIQ